MTTIFSNISIGFYYYISFFVAFLEYMIYILGSGILLGFIVGSFANLYYKR